jgi:pimeloyl-ACP methyl ester carboxylesterase
MRNLLLATAAAGALGSLVIAHASSDDDHVTCRRMTLQVTLAPGQSASNTVSGALCATADELVTGSTIQLLIHGATYNHDYWDFETVDGRRYSYARAVAARGFPTFAPDMPGTGNSSRPPSDQLSVQADAYVAHQIVQALRNGSLTGVQFGKVILVGHSLGSVVVWEEAINYTDVDGVIVTGAAHSITSRFLTSNTLHPAADDPKFVAGSLDSGYFTTIPGTRKTLFYSTPDFDPAVLAADEKRKDVVPLTELHTGLPVVTSTATLAIQVPVLTILGSNDFTTCGPNPQGGDFDCSSASAVVTQEAPFYSHEARLHACVVPDSGHDLSLAVDHQIQTADAIAWSFTFVGQRHTHEDPGVADHEGALPWNNFLPWNCY